MLSISDFADLFASSRFESFLAACQCFNPRNEDERDVDAAKGYVQAVLKFLDDN